MSPSPPPETNMAMLIRQVRDAMWADGHASAGLYFGARNGAVWGSADEGETWRQLIADLPDVMCVRAAAV